MVFRSKKGQSALEFLMTYGWAFLVALVVIGGLAYFGVLDPLSWLPSRCKFGAGEIGCSAYDIDVDANSDIGNPTDDGIITLKLVNAIGKTVKIANITAYTDTLTRVCTNTNNEFGHTEFAPYAKGVSEVQNEGTGSTGAELDPTNSNSDALLWIEGKSIVVRLAGCEFAQETVQTGKKQKFFVDVEYYSKIDGVAFSKTVRGEVFTQTEK